jgi:hypothetical protein
LSSLHGVGAPLQSAAAAAAQSVVVTDKAAARGEWLMRFSDE